MSIVCRVWKIWLLLLVWTVGGQTLDSDVHGLSTYFENRHWHDRLWTQPGQRLVWLCTRILIGQGLDRPWTDPGQWLDFLSCLCPAIHWVPVPKKNAEVQIGWWITNDEQNVASSAAAMLAVQQQVWSKRWDPGCVISRLSCIWPQRRVHAT